MKTNETAQKLGNAVKAKRQRLKLMLEDVAAETGVSASTISRVEAGNKCNAGTMAALADWIGVPIDRLFAGGEIETGDSVIYYPDEPVPNIVEAHLLKDKTLTPEHARALSEMFRVAYNQFSGFEKKK